MELYSMDVQSAIYGFFIGFIGVSIVGVIIFRVINGPLKKHNSSLNQELVEQTEKNEQAICHLRHELERATKYAETLLKELSEKKIELAVAHERMDNFRVIESDHVQLKPKYHEMLTSIASYKQQVAEYEKKELENKKQQDAVNFIIVEKDKSISQLHIDIADIRVLNTELATRIEEERKQSEQNLKLLEDAQEKLSEQFQNLANKIFEEKGKKFTEQNKEHIGVLINPLREQLGDFKKKIEDTYEKETRDRVSLKAEIANLRELNQQINQEAKNLTNALTKDNKAMGDWGEMQLERILEDVGLVKGREYEAQGVYENEEGAKLRPDFIVHLPEDKDVVIDSKVTLDSYVRYCSTENEVEKGVALKDLIISVKAHVKGLKDKDYRDLKGVRTLDFVLMFIPVEGALMLALDSEPKLFKEAFEAGVMIVGPTTLMGTLRTIERIWRFERQNKNAQKMAEEAGKIYDQFFLVVESLDDIGDKLEKAHKAYEQTQKRLVDGRGNLATRINNLKKLGATTKKELAEEFMEKAELGDSRG